ncbi:retrotransposon protein, putative, ty1-copia subclass [Tanacetum coccineum]
MSLQFVVFEPKLRLQNRYVEVNKTFKNFNKWGGRGVKEKNSIASNIEVVKDGVVPIVASVVQEGVTPSMVDMTVKMRKQNSLDDTSVPESYPLLSTSVTTTAGNAPDKSSYANITGKPSGKKMNIRTLFTPGGNGIDVVVPVDFIRAISERFANTAYDFFLGEEGGIPFWVKLHGVPVMAFNEDGFSAIATKLGTPLMLDSYTSDMCMQSWGRSRYARVMIELRANVKLKDNIVVAMPKITGDGMSEEYSAEYRHVPKKPTASSSVNKMKSVEPTIEVSNSNPFELLNSVDNDVDSTGTSPIIDKIGKFEELLTSGQAILVDKASNLLKKVEFPGEYDSEDEVASVDNDMARSMASERVGFGTQSLLGQ